STVASGPTPAGTGRRRGVGRPRRHAKASKADEEDDYEATLPKRKCTLTNGRGAGRPRKRAASSTNKSETASSSLTTSEREARAKRMKVFQSFITHRMALHNDTGTAENGYSGGMNGATGAAPPTSAADRKTMIQHYHNNNNNSVQNLNSSLASPLSSSATSVHPTNKQQQQQQLLNRDNLSNVAKNCSSGISATHLIRVDLTQDLTLGCDQDNLERCGNLTAQRSDPLLLKHRVKPTTYVPISVYNRRGCRGPCGLYNDRFLNDRDSP
ncbi:hypothetical protein D917_10257, partial [Trichinella nativa]